MARWVSIEYRIIRTVGIQIYPITTVGVLLGKPDNDWIIEARTEIILLGDGVKLLTGELEAVGDLLLTKGQISPRIVLIAVLDFSSFINDMGRRSHLVAGIVVIGPYRVCIAGNQLCAANQPCNATGISILNVLNYLCYFMSFVRKSFFCFGCYRQTYIYFIRRRTSFL